MEGDLDLFDREGTGNSSAKPNSSKESEQQTIEKRNSTTLKTGTIQNFHNNNNNVNQWVPSAPSTEMNVISSKFVSPLESLLDEGNSIIHPCTDEEVVQAFDQILGHRLEEKRKIDEVKRRMQNQKGFLNKQGHLVKNWKTRYFIIKGDNLVYYNVDANNIISSKKGQFSLKGCTVLEHNPVEGHEFCFLVKTASGKDFLLSAPSLLDRSDWIDSIRFISSEELPNYDFDNLSQTFFSSSFKLKGDRNFKCGWLEKQGGIRKIWRNYWFVLSSSRLTSSISYYENPGDKIKAGEIPIRDCIVQKMDIKGKSSSFVIHTKLEKQPKTFLFCAKTPKECEEWIEVIRQAITALEEEQNFIDFFFGENAEMK